MKIWCCLSIILLFLGFIIYGCGPSDESPASDQEVLQGVWVGRAVNEEGEHKVTISDNNIHFEAVGSDEWYKGTFVLNEKVTPRQVDFLIEECVVDHYVGKTAKGIYKIEADSLTIASYEPGSEMRPAGFDVSDGVRVFNLKRQPKN